MTEANRTENKRSSETRDEAIKRIVARHRNCRDNWWCFGRKERENAMHEAHADRAHLLKLLGEKP